MLSQYKAISSQVETDIFCQKIVQKKSLVLDEAHQEPYYLLTFLRYQDEDTVVSDSPFYAKENNVENLTKLLRLQHPLIVGFKHIFVEKSQITMISEYVDKPRLLPFIC